MNTYLRCRIQWKELKTQNSILNTVSRLSSASLVLVDSSRFQFNTQNSKLSFPRLPLTFTRCYNVRTMIVSRDNTERTGLAEQVEHLARRFHLADVYVFGSRAREIAALVRGSRAALQKSSSDVDIGIRPQQGLNLSPSEIVAIAIQLEDIFNVFRVDLVLLPEADPFLALDVIRGELLYAEEPVDQARYELFVLRRAGDLLPLKRERIEMILTSRGR